MRASVLQRGDRRQALRRRRRESCAIGRRALRVDAAQRMPRVGDVAHRVERRRRAARMVEAHVTARCRFRARYNAQSRPPTLAMNAPLPPSLLAAVELAPRDPILGVTEAFNADPNPQQGQPRRRRLLRRHRQGAAARMREARRARDDRPRARRAATCRSTASPPTTARCRRCCSAPTATSIESGRAVTVQALGGTGGAQGRRRFPAPLRARRAGLDQRSELGEPPRAVRRRGLHRQHLSVLRRGDARPRFRRDDRGARAAARGLDRRAARVLPQPDRRRSDARAVGADHRDRPRARPGAVPRHRLPGLRRRHRRRRRGRARASPRRPARCSSRARSRSRSRSTASASARCPSSPPTRTRPRACCRS